MATQGRPIGHNKTHKGQEIVYIDGLGCKDFPDCFTCPKPDCNYDSANDRKKGEENEK